MLADVAAVIETCTARASGFVKVVTLEMLTIAAAAAALAALAFAEDVELFSLTNAAAADVEALDALAEAALDDPDANPA